MLLFVVSPADDAESSSAAFVMIVSFTSNALPLQSSNSRRNEKKLQNGSFVVSLFSLARSIKNCLIFVSHGTGLVTCMTLLRSFVADTSVSLPPLTSWPGNQ